MSGMPVLNLLKHLLKDYSRSIRKHLTQVVVLSKLSQITKEDIKGIKICRQAKALWVKKFDKRQTPKAEIIIG
jgi:hypothetical protein